MPGDSTTSSVIEEMMALVFHRVDKSCHLSLYSVKTNSTQITLMKKRSALIFLICDIGATDSCL